MHHLLTLPMRTCSYSWLCAMLASALIWQHATLRQHPRFDRKGVDGRDGTFRLLFLLLCQRCFEPAIRRTLYPVAEPRFRGGMCFGDAPWLVKHNGALAKKEKGSIRVLGVHLYSKRENAHFKDAPFLHGK